MRHRFCVPFLLTTLLCAGLALSSGAAEKKAAPASAPAAADADPLYTRSLRAYRGLLRKEELEALQEEDPATALWMGSQALAEGTAYRLFAALPDAQHASLQEEGYLKWKLSALPPAQRKWALDAARGFNAHGEGPFPVDEKSARAADPTIGFVKVELLAGTPAQYAFFMLAPGAKRVAWVTLVRAIGTLTVAYENAYRDELARVLEKPDTAAIPAKEWVNPSALPHPAPPPPEKREPLIPESVYWAAVKTYRSEGKAGPSADPLVLKRAKSTDPRDAAANAFFARLPDRDHRTLLETGRLRWQPQQLSKEQRKLLEPLIRELNRQPRLTDEEPYNLLPFGGTQLGLTVVRVPEVEQPCVSLWVSSRVNPQPTWITLLNGEAVKAPQYYRAHLEQLIADP